MQAIQTKYRGPTNVRGARIKATAQAGSITVPYDYALGIDENHAAAARALAETLGWWDTTVRCLYSGALPDNSYAHVFSPRTA